MKSVTCLQRAIGSTLGVLLAAATLPACHSKAAAEKATASDEWVRSYPLEKTDEITIVNRQGLIDIQGGDVSAAEVRVERIVQAPSQKTAQDLLSKIEIAEQLKPGLVDIRTKGIEGILMGVTYETKFHVKVPSWANVRAQNTSGDLTVTNIAGRVIVGVTNGQLTAKELRGSVESRITNGKLSLDVAEFGRHPVFVRGTNGSVSVTIPQASDANLSLSSSNGAVTVTGLNFESSDPNGPQRGRSPRWRGRINGGGQTIEVQLTNGSISLSAREAPAAAGQKQPVDRRER